MLRKLADTVVVSCKTPVFPVSSHDSRLTARVETSGDNLAITSVLFYMATVIYLIDKRPPEGVCWCKCCSVGITDCYHTELRRGVVLLVVYFSRGEQPPAPSAPPVRTGELEQPASTYLDGHVDIEKSFLEILLLHPTGNVAEMQGRRGRVDVLVVLTAGLLEPVQPGVGVVFGQSSVRLTILRQLKHVGQVGSYFLLQVVEVERRLTCTLLCLLSITRITLPQSLVLSR